MENFKTNNGEMVVFQRYRQMHYFGNFQFHVINHPLCEQINVITKILRLPVL